MRTNGILYAQKPSTNFICYISPPINVRTLTLPRFIMVDIGGPGSNNDAGIFSNSTFARHLEAGTLKLPRSEPLPGFEERGDVPYMFVGDEAFPLRPDLMRPYSREVARLTDETRIFNYR
jgi:hypothetical protein